MDPGQVVQGILFAFFAELTAMVAAITGPTYDNLLVPELAPAALFPPISASGVPGGSLLGTAAQFSEYLLVNLVDPAIAVVAVVVALLYLARAALGRWVVRFESALPKLLLAV